MLDFRTDPDVPPPPPHIDWDKAKEFAHSMMKKDPNRWRVMKHPAKHMAGAPLP